MARFQDKTATLLLYRRRKQGKTDLFSIRKAIGEAFREPPAIGPGCKPSHLRFFITLPFAIGVFLAAVPGSALRTAWDDVFHTATPALPLSLPTGPILALRFRKLKWGLAGWTCLCIPPGLIALDGRHSRLAWSGLPQRG